MDVLLDEELELTPDRLTHAIEHDPLLQIEIGSEVAIPMSALMRHLQENIIQRSNQIRKEVAD